MSGPPGLDAPWRRNDARGAPAAPQELFVFHRGVPVALAIVTLGLFGCASGSSDTPADSASGGCPITVADAWVKAAQSGMTSAFGKITNTGSQEVVVTGASTPAAARVEIHEVADKDGKMVMQPKEGGLVLPAGASTELAPGGDHLMLMDLAAPVPAGEMVSIELTCGDGGKVTMTAQAKTYTGAQEQYTNSPSASASDAMGSMG